MRAHETFMGAGITCTELCGEAFFSPVDRANNKSLILSSDVSQSHMRLQSGYPEDIPSEMGVCQWSDCVLSIPAWESLADSCATLKSASWSITRALFQTNVLFCAFLRTPALLLHNVDSDCFGLDPLFRFHRFFVPASGVVSFGAFLFIISGPTD